MAGGVVGRVEVREILLRREDILRRAGWEFGRFCCTSQKKLAIAVSQSAFEKFSLHFAEILDSRLGQLVFEIEI